MFQLNPFRLEHASLLHFLMLQGMALLAYWFGEQRFRRQQKELDRELAELLTQLDATDIVDVDATEVVANEGLDDLKEIYGITSNVEIVLNQRGIFRFDQLARTPVATLKHMLASHGPMLYTYDPATWPNQAQLALEGKWAELRQWQQGMSRGHVTNYRYLLPK